MFLVAGLVLAASGCRGLSLMHVRTEDGRDRTYLVHLPSTYDPARAWPVVLNLHGGGGEARGAEASTLMDEAADREGFIVVYPEGVGKTALGKLFGTWNGGFCCGQAVDEGVDDTAFIDALLDELARQYAVDDARIFATGISNGGIMSHRLGCELSSRIAGIAPVAAPGPSTPCEARAPMRALVIHGTEDPCALYDGGERCGGCFSEWLQDSFGVEEGADDHFACESAPAQVDFWRAVNGCSDVRGTFFAAGDARCEIWNDCTSGVPVGLCTLEGGGHTWPGGEHGCANEGSKICQDFADIVGEINRDLDANEVMWRFWSGEYDGTPADPPT